MESRLQQGLDILKQRLLDMAAKVERNIGSSIQALRERDLEMLERVVRQDGEIDLAELQIDEDCISLIALRQPVARDLRFIATALKIVKDLERVGDIAKNIAKHGLGLSQEPPILFPGDLTRMASSSQALLKRALDAFVTHDADLARSVIRDDDEIDCYHRENVKFLIRRMVEEPAMIGPLTHLMAVNKFLERIGDHSTNIAAMVVYLVEGHDIRHMKNQERAGIR